MLRDGINKVVLLTHLGFETDLALAARLRGVDVIVGGDSHTLLGGSAIDELGLNTVGTYPAAVRSPHSGALVCVVQAWEAAHLVGVLSVDFDQHGLVTKCGGAQLLPIGSDTFRQEAADGSTIPLDRGRVAQALARHPALRPVAPDPRAASLVERSAISPRWRRCARALSISLRSWMARAGRR